MHKVLLENNERKRLMLKNNNKTFTAVSLWEEQTIHWCDLVLVLGSWCCNRQHKEPAMSKTGTTSAGELEYQKIKKDTQWRKRLLTEPEQKKQPTFYLDLDKICYS